MNTTAAMVSPERREDASSGSVARFADSQTIAGPLPATEGSKLGRETQESNPPHPPEDPAALLASLKAIGLATDLSADDLSITSTAASQAAAASSSNSRQNSTLSILLSRLSLLLSDLSRLVESHIQTHLAPLLDEAKRVEALQNGVHDISRSIGALKAQVETPRAQIAASLRRLRRDQMRLARLHQTSQLLKEAGHYVRLAKKLEGDLTILFDDDVPEQTSSGSQNSVTERPGPMTDSSDSGQQQRLRRVREKQRSREEALVRSARGLQGIEDVLSRSPEVNRLSFVTSYSASVTSARGQVLDRMEQCIVLGLRDLNPSLLSSSLLAASTLNVLHELVKDLMNDLIDVIKRRVDVAFASFSDPGDSASSSTSQASKESHHYASYRSQRRHQGATDPTSSQSSDGQRLVASLLSQLNSLITVEMTAVCSKIYLLQRVLGLMTQPHPRKENHPTDSTHDKSNDTASDWSESDDDSELMSNSDDSEEESEQPRGLQSSQQTNESKKTLLDEVTAILGDAPTLLFWRTFASSLSQSASKLSLPSLSHSLSRHLESQVSQLIDVFFEKTSVYTGLEEMISYGSDSDQTVQSGPGPEKTLLLRSLGPLLSSSKR